MLVEATFEASHTATDWPYCGTKTHGHSWRVQVCVEYDPQMDPPEHSARALLRTHIAELDGRDLGDMITPSRPDPYGVAAWLLDRMLISHVVTEVTVWQQPEIAARIVTEDHRR